MFCPKCCNKHPSPHPTPTPALNHDITLRPVIDSTARLYYTKQRKKKKLISPLIFKLLYVELANPSEHRKVTARLIDYVLTHRIDLDSKGDKMVFIRYSHKWKQGNNFYKISCEDISYISPFLHDAMSNFRWFVCNMFCKCVFPIYAWFKTTCRHSLSLRRDVKISLICLQYIIYILHIWIFLI